MTEHKQGGAHYICTGECGGVSKTPGNCNAKDCSKYGMPLQACNCADGSHESDSEEKHS